MPYEELARTLVSGEGNKHDDHEKRDQDEEQDQDE